MLYTCMGLFVLNPRAGYLAKCKVLGSQSAENLQDIVVDYYRPNPEAQALDKAISAKVANFYKEQLDKKKETLFYFDNSANHVDQKNL